MTHDENRSDVKHSPLFRLARAISLLLSASAARGLLSDAEGLLADAMYSVMEKRSVSASRGSPLHSSSWTCERRLNFRTVIPEME